MTVAPAIEADVPNPRLGHCSRGYGSTISRETCSIPRVVKRAK